MKIAFVADVHCASHKKWGGPVVAGLNRRASECVATLASAVQAAEAAGASAFFVLGDLFDNARPTPQLVRAVADALSSANLPVYVVLGNHDLQSTDGHDHACAAFELTSYATPIHVVERTKVVLLPAPTHTEEAVEVVCVPYRPGDASEWLASELAELKLGKPSGVRLLATHVGIWDQETPHFMRGVRDAVGLGQVRWLCDTYNMDAAFAGNWHQPRRWGGDGGAVVVIPGTLCPHSFVDLDVIGCAGMWETRSKIYSTARIAGPRFHVVTVPSLRTPITATAGESWYLRLQAANDAELVEGQELLLYLQQNPHVRGVELEDVRGSVLADEVADSVRAARRDPEDVIRQALTVEEPGTIEGALTRLKAYRSGAAR